VAAAQEKAKMYAAAAGVHLRAVVAIEDVSPDLVSGRGEGHALRDLHAEEESDHQALDPGALTVGAAVRMLFEIAHA